MDASSVPLTSLARSAGCAAKIGQADLIAALARLPQTNDPRVLIGASTNDDAAVVRLSDELALVETVDVFPPIVDDAYDYGRIAAANALSDIYAMGARPLNALSLVAWPIDTLGGDALARVFEGAAAICAEAGIAISGGHSIIDQEPKFGLFVTGTIHPANDRQHCRRARRRRAGADEAHRHRRPHDGGEARPPGARRAGGGDPLDEQPEPRGGGGDVRRRRERRHRCHRLRTLGSSRQHPARVERGLGPAARRRHRLCQGAAFRRRRGISRGRALPRRLRAATSTSPRPQRNSPPA